MPDEQNNDPVGHASRVVATGLLTAQEAYQQSMKHRSEQTGIHVLGLQQVIDEVRTAMQAGDTSCVLTAPAQDSVRLFLQAQPYLYRFGGEDARTVSWQPAYAVHLQEG